MAKQTASMTIGKKRGFIDNGFVQILSFFIMYTVLFLGICFIVFHPFISSNTSLVWGSDGLGQYFLWMQYTTDYVKEAIAGIKSGSFTLKMYDFIIGLGGDVRAFFKTELVPFLAVLFPDSVEKWKVYSFLTLLRIYLIGISFGCYGFYMKQKSSAVTIASLVYAFSTFTILQVLRHPQFAVATIFLPLLLIGLEMVIRRKSVLFYSFIVCLSLICSYYFLYMNTIVMGFYALLHVGDVYKKKWFKEFFQMLGRIIPSYLLGVGMATFSFFPSIARYLLSTRSAGRTKAYADMLWYDKTNRIRDIFLGLIRVKRSIGYSTTISVCVIVFPALIALFVRKFKDRLSTKIAVFLGFLFLLIPFAGFVFSGFNTVNNRWSYAFIFLMAFVIMIEFETICSFTWLHIILSILLTCGYAICMVCYARTGETHMIPLIMLVGLNVGLIIVKLIKRTSFLTETMRDLICKAGIIAYCVCCIAISGFYINSGFVGQFQKTDNTDDHFSSKKMAQIANFEDDGKDAFFRRDASQIYGRETNLSLALKYNGIGEFNSLIDSDITQYYTETENTGLSGLVRILTLDGRTYQEALACVKYYEVKSGADQAVPYGYKLDKSKSSEYEDIYVNQFLLPMGYTYDSLRSESASEDLPAIEKSQLSLEDATLSDEDLKDFTDLPVNTGVSGTVTEDTLEITDATKAYSIDGDNSLDGSTIVYQRTPEMETEALEAENAGEEYDDGCLSFKIEAQPNTETYIRLGDVDLGDNSMCDFTVKLQGFTKIVVVRNLKEVYSKGSDDYTINLGYSPEAETLEGTITLDAQGEYKIGSCTVYHVSMDKYEDDIASLKEESLENVSLSTNTVEGDITVSGEKLLALSIPYKTGWKVYVDGKETKVYQVNTMYMGVRLTEGTHHIVCKYASPGIFIGIIVSVIFVIIFIILLLRRLILNLFGIGKKKDKAEGKDKEESKDKGEDLPEEQEIPEAKAGEQLIASETLTEAAPLSEPLIEEDGADISDDEEAER